MVGLNVPPLVFLIGVNILILLLGCVLDASTIILVIIRCFYPPAPISVLTWSISAWLPWSTA